MVFEVNGQAFGAKGSALGGNIKVIMGNIEVEVKLRENATAGDLFRAAPFEASARTWGDEVYCTSPVSRDLETESAHEVVETGDVGYWPEGKAVCFFFGPTPVSRPGEIRPASAVTLIGRFRTPPDRMRSVRDGDPVRVEKA